MALKMMWLTPAGTAGRRGEADRGGAQAHAWHVAWPAVWRRRQATEARASLRARRPCAPRAAAVLLAAAAAAEEEAVVAAAAAVAAVAAVVASMSQTTT